MKKIFTLFAATLVASASAFADTVMLYWNPDEQELSSFTGEDWANTGSEDNRITWANGFSVTIQRSDKAVSNGSDLIIDGETLRAIKLSNGAANLLEAPEGLVINGVTIYSYINYNRIDKGNEGRTCYWVQLGDQTFTADDAQILKDYYDDAKNNPDKKDEYMNAPDVVTVTGLSTSSFIFKNTGEQLCYILKVEFSEGTPSAGISAINADNVDAPACNILGRPVDSNYRGLVIKGNQKFYQR